MSHSPRTSGQRLAMAALAFACAFAASNPAHAARKRQFSTVRPADAVEVWRCDFDDENWDVNYDGWPDRWERNEGPGYPHYVAIGLTDSEQVVSGRCLEARLDGAQAHITSPRILVLEKFSYYLDLKIKIADAPNSRVVVRIDYMNEAGEVRQTQRSDDLPSTGEWMTVSLGPTRPRYRDIHHMVLHIETERGPRGDLDGVVSLSEVWLGRLPSLEVTANNRFHVYTDPRDVIVTCALSGIRERDPEIRFQLLDATSSELGAAGKTTLDGREIVETKKVIREESQRASEIIVDGIGNHATGYEGSTEWHPRIEDHGGYGFYQVRVKMLSSETGEDINQRTITLAVIPPPVADVRGEFGWTLPDADDPLDFGALEKLLPLVGVNWVKLPIWFPADDPDRGEKIIQFAERLSASDIETVGVIMHPDLLNPDAEALDGTEDRTFLEVANVFGADPSRWLPLYDHIMSRLSLRIRWWQLGADGDTSFVGYADLVRQIAEIRRNLYRFGQDVGLGIGWRWDTPLLNELISWDFQQLASNPPLDAAQLEARMQESGPNAGKRWVLINTTSVDTSKLSLAQRKEQHIARVREFIEQIVVAKRHGADGIFLPNPFLGWHGVMTEEGKPGELLLPWRTAATLLGGAEYLGQLRLPSGSANWMFRRADGQVVMVVWNDDATTSAVTETLYLGDDIRHIDVWGEQRTAETAAGKNVIRVGRMPSFVLGLNESVARWRMAVKFGVERIPSVFGQEHANSLEITNTFNQGVGLDVRLFVPDRIRTDRNNRPQASEQWKIATPGEQVSAAARDTVQMPLEVTLEDAAIGDQPVRVDFEIAADRADERYRFSVWRSLRVGMGDIKIKLSTELDENGRLNVEQQMTNDSGTPLSFKCFLQATSRRRKRAQVFELGPEPDLKSYTYSQAKDLVGTEITLRAEEIDGPRVLIERFIAKP